MDEVTALGFSESSRGQLLSGGADDHFCSFDLNAASEEDSMQGMLNLEQEVRHVGFFPNANAVFALTSVNSVLTVDLDSFLVRSTWQYPNNSEDDLDRFMGLLEPSAAMSELRYMFKRDGMLSLAHCGSEKVAFRSKLSPTGSL